MKKENCALVIGGGITGYSVMQDLYGRGIGNIVLFDYYDKPAAFSNKLERPYVRIGQKAEDLLKALRELHADYERIVVFPTADHHLDNLFEIYDEVEPYCFLPLNRDGYLECSSKVGQYMHCQKLGVPYPESVLIKERGDISRVKELRLPVIVKPTIRWDHKGTDVFRNKVLRTAEDHSGLCGAIDGFVSSGVSFLASEVVSGDGSNLYSYYAYRSPKGRILNEWVGRKLSKYPNDYGVFSTICNQAPEVVREQGRALVEGMELVGVVTSEFKRDPNDDKYKLMEINLRNPMSGGLGRCTGVDLATAQYLDAIGDSVPKQVQVLDERVHYAYLRYEISNLLRRKGYWKTFTNVLFRSDRTHLAFFDKRDIKPFFMDMAYYLTRFGQPN